MIWRGSHLAFILLSCFLGVSGAAAQQCQLSRVAQLDMTVEKGKILIPVSIEGSSKRMAIDTGSPASMVDPLAASDLHLITHRLTEDTFGTAYGTSIKDVAEIRRLELGQLYAKNVTFLVWPTSLGLDNSVVGALGADLLHNYDVDMDFGAGKFSLFSKNHCPGKVVYWPASVIAVVPMHMTNMGYVIVPVTLDGHTFDALLDTGSYRTHISLDAAYKAFGLTPQSPDMTIVGQMNGSHAVPIYRHTFKTLELEGISIGNPTLLLSEDLAKDRARQSVMTGTRLFDANSQVGFTDVILGLNELRNLHLYIAYGEQKIYVTPASLPAGAATNASPTATGTSPAAH
jgi:predicted aspartyl protease